MAPVVPAKLPNYISEFDSPLATGHRLIRQFQNTIAIPG